MRVSNWLTLGFIFCAGVANAAPDFQLGAFRKYQRRAFENQHWGAFFGAAQGYRRYWWKDAADPELVTLEVLGLIRFCHYREALILTSALRAWAGSNDGRADLVSVLNRLEALIPGVEALKLSLEKRSSAAEISKTQALWPIPSGSEHRLHPASLRAKVEDRCVASH